MSSSSLKIVHGLAFQVYGFFSYLLARIFFGIRIYGQEKILSWEKQNNLGRIFVSRHWSCWDPILLWAAFWKLQYSSKIKCVAKDNLRTLFKCFPFLSSFAIFINQKNTKRNTIREMISLIKQGVNTVVFPEGSVVPEYKKIGGLVSLVIEQTEKATNQKVAIFPIKIDPQGPWAYGKPGGSWLNYLRCRVKIDLEIGKHVFLDDVEKMISKEALNKHRREEIVEELLRIVDQI